MANFILDEISAKTLPALDAMLDSDNRDRAFALVDKTSGASLARLVHAAISRHRVIGATMPQQKNAHFLEAAIIANIHNSAANHIEAVRSKLSDEDRRSVLKLSLLRFKIIDKAVFENFNETGE